MTRHRHTDRSPRTRRPRRLSFERLEIRLEMTGIPTVGLYDENVVDPNTVDFVAIGSSVSNTDFTNQIASAFGQDMGGVIDGEVLGQLYSYGTSQSKVLTIQPAAGTNWGIGSGYHISKTGGFATSDPYNTLTLNFVSIDNGLPNEYVVSVGVTALSITGRDYGNVTVTANLLMGGSVSATRHINDPTEGGDTFYGLTAPANDFIKSITLAYDGPVFGTPDTRLWFDDLGFITAQVTTNNHPPVANDDSYTVSAVAPTTVSAPGVLANDTDPDTGQTLAAALVSQPAHGGVTFNADGSFTYTPVAGFSGPDSFTYKANDGQYDSNVATVQITVPPPPPPPGAISGTLWDDFNGDGQRASGDTGLAGRTVYLDQNQNGLLDPGEPSTTTAADGSYAFTGLPLATYHVAEVLPTGWSQTSPTPSAEQTVVLGGTPQTVFDFNELASTSDQTIGPYHKAGFTFDSSVDQPDKFYVYGSSDSVRYAGSPALATEWVPVTVSLKRDDGAAFSLTSIDLSPTWTSVFTPIVTFVGTKTDGSAVSQSFNVGSTLGFQTFAVTALNDVTAVTWFQHDPTDLVEWDNVTVQPPGPLSVTGADFGSMRIADAAPVAVNDTYSTPASTALTVAAPGVMANDTDPDGDPIAAVLVTGPSHGTLSLDASGAFTYTPSSGYNGPDSFTYKANDGRLDSNVATVSLTVTVTPVIPDPGFEQVQVGAGHFQYRPTGSPWTFAGNAGISANNSGFTSGNPPAPEGTQVAFLQSTGSFTQTVTGWAAGSYVLTFDAAQRGNQASHQDFEVLVNGVIVGTFTPTGTSYLSLTTAAFTVTAGSHTIKFQGLDSAGGDNTAFADAVTVAVSQSTAPAVPDAGFEQVQVGAGHFQYRPTGSPWTFAGNAGISANNSGFTSGNPSAPEGTQVAFLQSTGSFTQTVTGWAAGSYMLTFDAAQRGNQASHQDFEVLVDGVIVGTFTPTGTSYQSYSTAVFTVTAGSHTIKFQGLDSAGGDNTALVDAVVQANLAPSGDLGFEQVQVGAGHFQYRPTGSPWTFSGNSGISANNSGFTSGNPPAPEGTQVAFLQSTGSFTQTVTGWAAGSYVLTFDAAQRGNQASHQDFEVLVDGVIVGTFTPTGTSYLSLTTAAFTVTAGSHTIKFQGLDSAGGDNTAFADAVTVAVSQSTAPAVPDAGFEQVQVGAGHFQYRPTGSPWTFAGNAGISANNSGFTSGNPSAPEGTQVAFLQSTGSFTQTVTGWAAGSYMLTFDAAQRGNQASHQDFEVLVDGVIVGTFTPTGTSYQSYSTAVFTVTAGSHTIKFQGLDSAGGDNTAFVDQVVASL